MDNDLLLLSGNDIPFMEAQITIHQPTIKEIAYIGEEIFFTGCELINFSKNILSEEDKVNLENKTNFDILIAILKERNAVMQKNRNCVEMVLALIFPYYTIEISNDSIILEKDEESHSINNDNFESFKLIFNQMFSFSREETRDYNPSGDLAKKIAEKLKKRHQKLAELKQEKKKIDILSRYISILAVGEHKDLNSLLNLSVYQLFDEFERFKLKMSYDIYIQAKMAGAKDLKEVED
jgi:hypothetical protein